MARTFDLAALRSFLAVADSGGVTRAAGMMNLTQSAVSMQIRRLEEFLGAPLIMRAGRGIQLTPQGEKLAAYARRMVALNDEAWARLTAPDYTGEIALGVPHDIVHQCIPQVMRQFAAAYPKVKVAFHSSFTTILREDFARGALDIILTTEQFAGEGAETLASIPLIWVGAPGGQAWKQRPLKIAFEEACVFRRDVQRCLDAAGIPWEMEMAGQSSRAIEVATAADLAVHVLVDGSERRFFFEKIPHGGALPELWDAGINMYVASHDPNPARTALAEMIRRAYRALPNATASGATAAPAAQPQDTIGETPPILAAQGTTRDRRSPSAG